MNQNKKLLILIAVACWFGLPDRCLNVASGIYQLQGTYPTPASDAWTAPNTLGNKRDRSTRPTNASEPLADSAFPMPNYPAIDSSVRHADLSTPLFSNQDFPETSESYPLTPEQESSWNSEGKWLEPIEAFLKENELGKTLGSLALVLGLFFAFVWMLGKFNVSKPSRIPNEVVEVIGNKPFGQRQSLQLVRLGSKLVLLMNSPEGTQPIAEVTEPAEVEYLAALCMGTTKVKKPTATSELAIQQAAHRIEKAMQNCQPQHSDLPARLSELLRILENSTGTRFEA
ncbi:MAG: flagellar biosynthetic protein FliO [Planctomycetota bacterium]